MVNITKPKRLFVLLAVAIAAIHVVLVVGWGMQKEGFHEDEYYTYWSSTNDRELTIKQNYVWYSGYDLNSRFFVRDGEQFSLAKVVQNQVEDVHPPLYYISLNIFMSLFPGRFYKWFGILLNLLYSLITYAGILLFLVRMDRSDNRYLLALLGGLSFAVAPSSISNCMLTRMYTMSAMWTVVYANVFLLLIHHFNCSWRKFWKILLAGAVVCYLSFLTHYFALIVPFGLTLFYCIYVICKRKGIVKMLVYGCSMLAAIGLAIWTFPASLDHIFDGYRGTGAISSLTSSGFWGFMGYFLPLVNQYVFAGWMWVLLIVTGVCLILGSVFLIQRSVKKQPTVTNFYPLAASVCSCIWGMWFLCRTALMTESAAIRYFLPVIVFILPLMAYSIGKLVCCLPFVGYSGWKRKVFGLVMALLVMLPSVAGYAQGNMLFLYQDEKEKKAFSQEYSEYPAIMIYSRDVPYRGWYTDDQLWPFQAVFYADYEHLMADFEDERLFTAEKVVVFMDCPTDVLDKLVKVNPNLSSYTLVRHDPFFYVYLLE